MSEFKAGFEIPKEKLHEKKTVASEYTSEQDQNENKKSG